MRQDSNAPVEFLVSTTGAVRDIRANMGNADYSYSFVFKALEPVLAKLGRYRLVSHPESSLAYQAARSAAEGYRPVQLAIQPPHACYFTPEVPTIAFPFWEFPELPNRNFDDDTRQNWIRMLGSADAIITACHFTADAIRRSGIERPVTVVPVPMTPERFSVPDWDPSWSFRLHCRHLSFGGRAEVVPPDQMIHLPPSALWKRAVKRVFRGARGAYKQHVVRWLSAEAVERLFQTKNRILRRVEAGPTLIPASELVLNGLVYTSVFNLGDRRKNIDDLLSAFLLTFRDREDVTLVFKLATNPQREFHELKDFYHRYERIGLSHACRLVVITEFLSDDHMRDLMRASTYYVNSSKAEGACLPLQHAMAAGRPAIAPRHTAMLDYVDSEVAFVVESHAEPTHFPHDPRPRFDTSWHRVVWTSLQDQLRKSAEVARDDRAKYDGMAARGRARMRQQFSEAAAEDALRQALERLKLNRKAGRFAWSA